MNVLYFELQDGNRIIIRFVGTEPKVKFISSYAEKLRRPLKKMILRAARIDKIKAFCANRIRKQITGVARGGFARLCRVVLAVC